MASEKTDFCEEIIEEFAAEWDAFLDRKEHTEQNRGRNKEESPVADDSSVVIDSSTPKPVPSSGILRKPSALVSGFGSRQKEKAASVPNESSFLGYQNGFPTIISRPSTSTNAMSISEIQSRIAEMSAQQATSTSGLKLPGSLATRHNIK